MRASGDVASDVSHSQTCLPHTYLDNSSAVKKPYINMKVTNEKTRYHNYPVWEKFSVLQVLRRLVHIVTTTLNGKYELK